MNKIRVGLLIDDFKVTKWVYKLIEKINESPYAEIVLIVKNNGHYGSDKKNQSLVKKIAENFGQLAYIYYNKIENKLHKVNNNAFETTDAQPLLANIPVIEVTPKQTKYADTIESSDIEKIKPYHIDVFIRMGFRIIRGEILSVPRYGIWSYHHGDNNVNRGMPAGAWEFLEKWHTTGSVLQILSEQLDGGKILYKSHAATNTAYLNENRNSYYWKSVQFVPRMLARLYHEREHFFEKHVAQRNMHPEFYSNKLFTTPTNSAVLKAAVKKGYSKLRNTLHTALYQNQWTLLYHFAKKSGPSLELYKYKRLVPPKDRFWADPHVLFHGDKYYIFIEEVLYPENKGHISVIEMDEKGNHNSPQIVLETNYHLSYPFVFEHAGKYYMIPETKDNKTISLYESEEFPMKWKFKMNLMENVRAVDSTLLHHNNKWWLFTNIQEMEGASTSDELFLFFADDFLTQQWTPHPLNPIVSDVRNARPAGKIFSYNNNLYRPAQTSAYFYGWGIAINHIITLNEQEYEERTVNTITPNWSKDVRQTHTLSFANKLTVVDANIRRRKWGK